MKIHLNYFLKFTLLILLFTGTSLFGQNIRQADYYVDGINGNDSNNGTSPSTAKKSIAGIIALGSNISGKTIALRDSIIYRNSSTTETWRITQSNVTITNWWENVSTRFWGGTDVLPKITGGQQITSWSNYSGNVWSSTTNVSSASAVWLTFAGDSCVWGEQMSGVGSLVREGQYYISGGTMYIYAPSDPDSYYESIDRDDRSSIIYVNSGTNVSINNIEVYGSTNFNIFFNEGTEGGVVDNCISHHAGTYSNLLVGGGSHCIQTRSGITIKNSVFYEGTNHGIHMYPMNSNLSGVVIEHNIVFNCHHTGIDQNSSGPTISGTIIRYNKIYETTWARERQFANFASSSHQIGIWEQGSMVQNAEIAYNLVYNSYRGNIALNGSNNSVYNNTVVHTVAPLSSYNGSDVSGNGVAKNNVVCENSSINCISGFTTSNNITYNYGSGGTSGGTNVNPQFQNYTGLDFHLQSGSPAIDFGTNLGYTYDLDGNTIVGNPDAGAYEFNGGGGGGNDPPNQPTNPSPGNGAVNQPINTTVTWSCSDPNGDPLTYDVYFGTSNNPPLVSGNQTAASYNPGGLNNSTTYYWKIVAKDNQGGTTAGPVWNFTTVAAGGNNPPTQPTNPSPGNGAVNQPINTTVTWSCSDPNGDPLTYDVYFGTSSNPPLVSGNQTGASYNPGGLNNSTTYYWKIVAKDNQGGTTAGPVWNFTTVAAGGNNPPNQPTNPNPGNGAVNQPINTTVTWSCSDPNGDPLTYDVYFGTSNNPPLVSGNQTGASYNPGGLNNSTTYYWKIVAKDNQGASTAGPVWSFSTIADSSNGDTVTTDIKVFLQGPYTDNAMYTDLSNNSLVPSSQPYDSQPWNYAGNETVNTVPQNVVDWILVELRSGTGSSSVVARRAAFLRNDGIIVDLNGQTKVLFPGIQSGQYYLVIYHRNHLAIMSKNRVLLTESSSRYDFTNSQNQAYGNLPMKSLGNGKFGLYAADGNSNGNVNNSDYTGVWKKQNGSLGYEDGDFDLNGGVNIVDKNSIWNPNKGKNTQVP